MSRGFVILAQNTSQVNYIECAELLAKNIRNIMPKENISLITDDIEHSSYFDRVIALPYGDLDPSGNWKLINDWQVYEASPYDYTIKLEADLYLPQNIEYWWDILKERDLVVCSKIRNFKQEISDVRFYRNFIDENNLPDVYNSITYFKKSELAQKFFMIIRDVFENWSQYRDSLKCSVTEKVSTDWAYAIACHIIGVENTLYKGFDALSMIHMKQFINDLPTEIWTDKLVYEINNTALKIQTIPQMYPFHYYIKNFRHKLNEKI